MNVRNTERQFQKNLERWSHIHPREAIWLPYIEDSHLRLCSAKNGQPNLRRREGGRSQYYHSNSDPKKEAEAWFSGLDLLDRQILYVYGVGLGHYYDAAKKWLRTSDEHVLVFLEDDAAVIRQLFETKKGGGLLRHPQVHLYYFNEVSDADNIFNELFWNFLHAKMEISCLKYYGKIKGKKFEELRHQITYDASVKNDLLEEYLQYGIVFFRNFYANLTQLTESYLGNALFGQFKNIPAIICGAGPSLQKNVSLLKGIRDKAIIFAGSSSLNALEAHEVAPHLGVGIDPNPMQYERLRHLKGLNFPFFYRNRMFPDALALAKGPRLYIPGSGGYDIAEWFEQQLGIEGERIEEGSNVVNFCLEIANRMGCNPIIFVGVDLAYTDAKAYASGIEESSSVEGEVEKIDIYGKPTQTLWKWVAEAKWIGDFAKKHPKKTVINATEGGLGFPGVPNKSLKDVIKKHLPKRYRLPSRIHKQIQQGALSQVTTSKIVKAKKDMFDSLERCNGYLQILLEENDRLQKDVGERFQTGKGALAEAELAEEPAFLYVLGIFNQVATRMLTHDSRKLQDPKNKMTDEEKGRARLNLTRKKLQFLQNVVTVNLELLRK